MVINEDKLKWEEVEAILSLLQQASQLTIVCVW